MSTRSSGLPLASNSFAYITFLAGVCAALHVWKLPPALPELQRQLGMTLVESGFLLSLVQVGGMTLGVLVGLVAEKIGLRRCVLAGLTLLAASSAVGPLFDSKLALLLSRGIEGLGFLMVVMPAPGMIRRMVEPAYLSRLLGLWGAYVPLATILALVFGSWLLSVASWQVLWWVLALLTAVIGGVLYSKVPSDAVYRVVGSDDPTASKAPRALALVRQTLTSKNVWLVTLCAMVYASQWMAVVGFLPSIYVAEGFSGTTAGLMAALVGGSNALGSLGGGRLVHRGFQPHNLIITAFVTMSFCTIIAFGVGAPSWLQLTMALIFSAVGGLVPGNMFFLALQMSPSREATSTSVGLLQQCLSFGQFIGPPIVAWVATLAGNWHMTWVVSVVLSAFGVFMALNLGKAMRARALA